MIKLIKVATIIAVSIAIGFWLGMRAAQPDVNTLQKALLSQSGLNGGTNALNNNGLNNNGLNGLGQGANALSPQQQAVLRQALINAIANLQKGAAANPNLNLGAGANTKGALGDRLIELGNRLKAGQ